MRGYSEIAENDRGNLMIAFGLAGVVDHRWPLLNWRLIMIIHSGWWMMADAEGGLFYYQMNDILRQMQ